MTPLDTIFQSDFEAIIRQTSSSESRNKVHQVTSYNSASPVKNNTKANYFDSSDYGIPKVFCPLIMVSKWSGCCPVNIIREGSSKGFIKFQFRKLSRTFLVTFSVGFLLGFFLFFWILNTGLNIYWPVRIFSAMKARNKWLDENLIKSSSLISTLNIISRLSLPLGAWMTMILSWTDTKSLCVFLNEWPTFMKAFRSAFSSYYTPNFNLGRTRNASVAFWFAPVFILLFTLKCVNFFEGQVSSRVLGFLFAYFSIFASLGTRALSYIKDFLLLKTIHMAYVETLNGIKAQYDSCGKSISREQVRHWMELISFIRLQTSRVEKHISLENLWSIFEVFYSVLLILSTIVFLFMNNALEKGLSGNFLHFSTVSTMFFISSLYWKTGISEHITNVEEGIADALLEMETADDDCETRLEMKLILDIIHNDPVQVEVGKILILNRKLLLSFFSQLAAYLVVILQFTKS